MARVEGAYPGTNRNAPGFAVDPPAGGPPLPLRDRSRLDPGRRRAGAACEIGPERRTTRSARIPSAFGAAPRGPAATDPVALA